MLFKKRFFKRSKLYFTQEQESSDPVFYNIGKNGKRIKNKAVQVLQLFNTFTSEELIDKQTAHRDGENSIQEICALQRAKLTCSDRKTTDGVLEKSKSYTNQIFQERKLLLSLSQKNKNHPAFQSSLYLRLQRNQFSKKGENGNRVTPTIRPLQSIQECEEEHL